MFEDLLFLPLDIPNPPKEILGELDKVPFNLMAIDEYRTCQHIPVMNINRETKEFFWKDVTKHITILREYLEDNIFTWAEKSRVVVITTEPYKRNAIHIDCSPDKFNTMQHKFRYVFQGNDNDLEFVFEENVRRPKEIDKPFMMDGSWPHQMINRHNKNKYTLALGAPWEPSLDNKKYWDLLEQSYDKYSNYFMASDGFKLPKNYEQYYEKKYKEY